MRKLFTLLTFVLVFWVFQSPSYAHKLLLEPAEEGLIKIMYEDGKIPPDMQITVYDLEGNQIDQGILDESGFFHFDPLAAEKIVADDGMGHRLEWTVGSPGISSGGWGKYVKMSGVVLLLLGVAFWSVRKNKS